MSLRFLLLPCFALVCCVATCPGPAPLVAATAWAQSNPSAEAKPSSAPAHSAASTPVTPAEAQRALAVLQDPAQRARLVETLRTIASAAGPAPAEAPAGTEAAPAAAKSEAEKAQPVTLQPDSLAAQLLSGLAGWPRRVVEDTAASLRTVPDLYLLREWVVRMVNDPSAGELAFDVAWQLALVLGIALLLERAAALALRRPAQRLAAGAPDPAEPGAPLPGTADEGAWRRLRRLPAAAARLGLELVPVAVFWTGATVLANFVPVPLTRLAILIAINAYTAIRVTLAIGRMLLAPEASGLRLLRIDDDHAAYLMRWLRRLILVAALGVAAAGLALLFGLHPAVYATLIRVDGLVIAILLAIMVLRLRGFVAAAIAGAPEPGEPLPAWRKWLAATWHYLALLGIMAGWIGWAAGFESGAGGIWLLLGTVAIVAGARLVALVLTGILDRITASHPDAASPTHGLLDETRLRARRWTSIARLLVNLSIAILTGLLLLEFWGVGAFDWFRSGQIGARLLSALVTVGLAVLAAVLIWELANAALERRLARLSEAGTPAHAARLRTLLPMLRAALFITIALIVGLTALSEIGVNIAPLLAGAGIVGVAVGFGSQKLVQDVVTGMFVLFENAIQVGDTITVAGLSGKIERLSVRTIWLRGADGALHVVPFSSVGAISNANRGLGTAAVSVTIAYTEDSDRAADAMRGIASEMHEDSEYAERIIGDLQLWVDSVRALGVTLSGTIPCTDSGRWPVQREFNRRLQKRFQELDIALGLKLGDA
ncbi:MAG: mechanosensitive ion channel domain-containing protein [Alphaproteobacteria bacterium]